ncbi:ABC transporter ATP-binding protein [Actinomyces ruminis]|uniref:ABC transporter ATP-binding protein n=1 Tax=Actinomyces ruminis TaxID=1937003 RepID=A0ABX4MHI9_9ACTO|nr:ATP-binding cassette domain-containing protein [Actinomyces ruminis]PHP53619.1 ABC transporter ATP-binding protein [Actinomyces ruminis]
MEHVFEIDGLRSWYDRTSPVLTDVSLTLEAGEAVGLLGVNGAGKTTMLKALCDAHRGYELRSMRYRGRRCKPDTLAFKRQRYFALTSDTSFPAWSLDTFIRFLDRAYGERKHPQLLDDLIDGFSFGGYRSTPFGQLSSGSRKKAALIAAFHTPVDILFLDEPVDFLDFAATEYLYHCIVAAAERGQAVLLSSHIAESFTRCTTRIYVLSAGRLSGPFDTPGDSDAVAALIK